MVGDNLVSVVYVCNKEKVCEKLGMVFFGKYFFVDMDQEILMVAIVSLNEDEWVDGILV